MVTVGRTELSIRALVIGFRLGLSIEAMSSRGSSHLWHGVTDPSAPIAWSGLSTVAARMGISRTLVGWNRSGSSVGIGAASSSP
jgi:hypothetical protein